MAKINGKKAAVFAASFAGTVLIVCILVFFIFKGMFYGVYMSRGDKMYESGNYSEAVKCYNIAKSWNAKKQQVYLSLAKAYEALEDYENAGTVIDQAIDKKITTDETGLEQLYLARIKIYTAAGQLIDAVNYTDNISDQYILRKIQGIRPGDLSYTPTQGDYDKTQKMTITVQDGQTVYYTTDGTYPTKFSNVYVEPINIGNGRTSVTAIAVDAQGLVSPLLSVTYNVTNENEVVSFNDSKIEEMVRIALSKPSGVIRVKELESVTKLANDAVEGYVKTLSDLDLMPNLETLYLDGETMMLSISQLSGKSKLTTLSLAGCGLDSTEINVLGSLSALETLDLSYNDLTSISVLSNITTLKYVYLSQNSIDDLSALSASKSIVLIDASNNRISAVPDFEENTTLESLMLGSNHISDISTVHRFTALTYLDISKNLVKNAKNLSTLNKLETLNISSNGITNFDFLKSLTNLKTLNLDDTSFVSTKTIAGLDLMNFSASGTGIATLNDIKDMTELVTLEIADTNVTDLTPIKDAQKLDYLNISGCNIQDLTVLSELKGLYTLKAVGLDVSGVVFANPDMMIVE